MNICVRNIQILAIFFSHCSISTWFVLIFIGKGRLSIDRSIETLVLKINCMVIMTIIFH